MSIFEDIFGKSPMSFPTQDLRRANSEVFISSELIAQGRFLLMNEGKLYQITAEEVDLSSLKIKPKASTCDGARDQHKEEQQRS